MSIARFRSPRSIEGARISLRHPVREDLGFIRSLWSDPATMEAVGGPIVLEERQAGEWFARMVDPGSATDCYFLICRGSSGPIGEVSFHRWDAGARSADLNIKIHARFRGQGNAREALSLFLRFYFQNTPADSLADHVARENLPAQQFLRGFGFRHDPSRSDVHRMVLTRSEFVRRNPTANG